MQSIQGSQRNDMKVEDENGRKFHVFIRICEKFQEDFSIGLRYMQSDDGSGSLILIRCNGPHGRFIENGHPHHGYHIHWATPENLANGRRAEAGGHRTNEFSDYNRALKYFLTKTNIQWTEEHFPSLIQLELPFTDDDN